MDRSEFFVWAGSVGIVLSAALGIVAVFFPLSWLIIISLALGGTSAPFAILSARYATREQQRQFQALYSLTPTGRQEGALRQVRGSMEKQNG